MTCRNCMIDQSYKDYDNFSPVCLLMMLKSVKTQRFLAGSLGILCNVGECPRHDSNVLPTA